MKSARPPSLKYNPKIIIFSLWYLKFFRAHKKQVSDLEGLWSLTGKTHQRTHIASCKAMELINAENGDKILK